MNSEHFVGLKIPIFVKTIESKYSDKNRAKVSLCKVEYVGEINCEKSRHLFDIEYKDKYVLESSDYTAIILRNEDNVYTVIFDEIYAFKPLDDLIEFKFYLVGEGEYISAIDASENQYLLSEKKYILAKNVPNPVKNDEKDVYEWFNNLSRTRSTKISHPLKEMRELYTVDELLDLVEERSKSLSPLSSPKRSPKTSPKKKTSKRKKVSGSNLDEIINNLELQVEALKRLRDL